MHLIIPKNYNPVLNLRDTEIAIKLVKDFFETELARALNLTRVSAPIMVTPGSGLNDNLNGVERPVSFDVLETGETAEIVHSLAKWKRQALKTYGFQPGEGLYTDMNAIRRDETTDNIHSIFVDQWDWEKIITPKQRTMETLQATVRAIYLTLRKTEGFVCAHYPHIKPELPDDITFVSSQELEDLYPDLPPKEREYRAVREYGAVFLTGIGGALRSGQMHDGRAPDYDDCHSTVTFCSTTRCWTLRWKCRAWASALTRRAAPSAGDSRLRGARGAAIPKGTAQRRAAPDDGRRHRAEPHVRLPAAQGACGRGAGEPMAAGRAGRVQEGKYSAAVSKAMGASLKCGLSPCFIIPYEIAPSCRDSRRCPICFILHDPPPKCFLTYACLCCCVTHAFLSEFAFC